MRKILLLLLIALSGAGTLFGASSPSDYRYFMELSPPAAIIETQLNSIPLNDAVWEKIASPDDMRLYTQDGREVPFLLQQRFISGEKVRYEAIPGVVKSFEQEENKAILLLQVGKDDGNGACVDALTIRTGEQNFEKQISIFARSIEGGDEWQLLVQDQPFFDRNPRFALRSVSFELPRGNYRELKIQIDNYREDYLSPLRRITESESGDGNAAARQEERKILFRELKIDGVDLAQSVPVKFSKQPLEESRKLEILDITTNPAEKTTVIRFDCRNIPLTRLELASDTTNFSRRADFETEDGRIHYRAQLESVSIPKFSRHSARVDFAGEQRFGVCRLTIQNDDNPPLEKITLLGCKPVYHLVTLGTEIPDALYYAGNGVEPGDYDLARTLAGIDPAELAFNEFQPGVPQQNPHFNPSGSGGLGFDPERVFSVVAVLLAVALIAFIFRNIRRVENPPPEE